MKCIILLELVFIIFSFLTACGQNTEILEGREIDFLPVAGESFIGDPMPYYDGESMHVFFLEDLRDGAIGYHPWSKFVTNDFVTYEYSAAVIPFVGEHDNQERALGTGSVVKGPDELYYAFYTAHNPNLAPKEVIMRAVSSDLDQWVKDETFLLSAHNQQNQDDFRDPFVFWNEEADCYWMLITTRMNDDGIIKLYTSADLYQWEDEGLFYNAPGNGNLECPSLVSFEDKWYLAYSEQWPNRVVRYLVANSSEGPFKNVGSGTFDGEGFYAGRLEVMEDHLYVFGWIPTKTQHRDRNAFDWAGNLAVHELSPAKENGRLLVKPMEIRSRSLQNQTKSIVISEEEHLVVYEAMQKQAVVKGSIEYDEDTEICGFTFNVEDSSGELNIVIDSVNDCISFYNVSLEDIDNEEPQLTMAYDFSSRNRLDFEMVVDGSALILYINGEIAFSTRMYHMQGKPWGIFSRGAKVKIR